MTKPNILFIVLDSVRAKNCSLYGHDNETTPYLSEFAKNSTIFTQARSPGIHSIASHASIFTGYHVEEHRLTEHESYLNPQSNIWHQLRQSYGYTTASFSANYVVSVASNLTECFEQRVERVKRNKGALFKKGLTPRSLEHNGKLSYFKQCPHQEYPARTIANGIYWGLTKRSDTEMNQAESFEYVDLFLDWISDQQSQWAVYMNLMDAHWPYVPKAKYDKWGGEKISSIRESMKSPKNNIDDFRWGELRAIESLYDGCIYQLDNAIEELVTGLKQLGQYDDTLVIITSDHGEGFGERSLLTPSVRLVGHSWGIDELLTHVPLLVKEPRQQHAKKIPDPASLTYFPDVAKEVINNGSGLKGFAPEEKPIACSTFRIEPPGERLPMDYNNKEDYFGPWRAVYLPHDQRSVIKYAIRMNDYKAMISADAQHKYPVNYKEGAKILLDIFDQMSSVNVEVGDVSERELGPSAEKRLSHLGYLR